MPDEGGTFGLEDRRHTKEAPALLLHPLLPIVSARMKARG